ncbi:MAG: hypothetical protein ACTSUT_15440 [Promethearchaeota archaeon]
MKEPNISFYSCGRKLLCGITGDTKIFLADSRNITFLELIAEYNAGVENFCFSLDKCSNIVIAKIEKPIQIKNVSKLIKITLDNDDTIYCDFNCNFITRDNIIVDAVSLHNDQSLMPLKINYAEKIPIIKRSYKDKRFKLEKYLVVYNPATDSYDYIHRLADDYNLMKNVYTKESGNIRHHIDLNKYNNNPPNIKKMFFKEHFEIHSKFAGERAKKGEIGWGRAHALHPEFYSAMTSKNMKKLHQDSEFQKRHSIRASKNISKYLESKEFYEMTRNAGDRGKKYLNEYNKSEKGRKKSSEIGKHGKMKCQECGQEVFGRAEMNQHYKEKHPLVWRQQQKSFQKGSIEYVRSEEGRKAQSERAKNGKMTCQKCGKIIFGSSELRKHYAEAHHDFVSCPFCGKLCKGKGGLSNHIRFCPKNPDHQVREIGSFPCPFCNEVFGSQRGLSGHITRGHKVINHKIIYIEIIECEPIAIYNLYIKNFDNFGLSAGIFIHAL